MFIYTFRSNIVMKKCCLSTHHFLFLPPLLEFVSTHFLLGDSCLALSPPSSQCDAGCHQLCARPPIEGSGPKSLPASFRCAKCAVCVSCGTHEGPWTHNYTLCAPCASAIRHNQFCPQARVWGFLSLFVCLLFVFQISTFCASVLQFSVVSLSLCVRPRRFDFFPSAPLLCICLFLFRW
jgi:hypothetical protein